MSRARLGVIVSLIVILLGGFTADGSWVDDGPPTVTTMAAQAQPISPIGFAPASKARQLEAEGKALAVPTPENARKWLKTLTEEPHVAGTPADYKTAVFVRDQLGEWGWKAELVPYDVLLNYPRGKPELAINRPQSQSLSLDESPLAADKDSASSDAFPAFHGYGVSGQASGQVVYVNYGRHEDFVALEKQGISVRDKIVLARYGGNFRGLKVLNAQKRGARGILIYSDPGDDGYSRGDVYPAGPFRPGSAIQRGSVQFLSLGPGDPSTPRGPSVKIADRLAIDFLNGFPMDLREPGMSPNYHPGKDWEAKSGLKRDEYFATIPSLPINYNAATEIFKVLAGPGVPAGWQGGLPLAYHLGPGPAEVTFSIHMDYQVRPIWNVIATIPGSSEPDRWIMVGNHRDAWVFGAVDPGSGTAATLEMCRAIGSAVKAGWKPRRTLMYASWDAEEYGLVGSTEWGEEHAKDIDQKVALLLNVDSAVSGRDLQMGGVPSLRDLALDAAGAITDIRTGKSLRAMWTEARRTSWSSASPLNLSDPVWDEAKTGSTAGGQHKPRGFFPQMQALGSGSDYTVFLDHLGIPALDVGFSGRYGVYHSIYDDFTWMERFGDPEFVSHTMAARLYALMIMRAAAAELLPFRFVPYGEALRDHVDELRLIRARQVRGKADESNKPTANPTDGFEGLPALVHSVKGFQRRAADVDKHLDDFSTKDSIPANRLSLVNDALTRVERAFLLPGGLPGRPWFKHAVYAPGLTTGYGAWPFPAIRQALEENKPEQLKPAVAEAVASIDRATAALGKVLESARAAGAAR
jgi:N-acetylated-alpha-linked acidic dipeptidase